MFPLSLPSSHSDAALYGKQIYMLYKEKFPIGSTVHIADACRLQEFHRTWKYHHKLTPEQLKYAGEIGRVEKVGFYHGGDVLYELRDVPGIWHEQCLGAADSVTTDDR